jgi:hypothetical protein
MRFYVLQGAVHYSKVSNVARRYDHFISSATGSQWDGQARQDRGLERGELDTSAIILVHISNFGFMTCMTGRCSPAIGLGTRLGLSNNPFTVRDHAS